MINTITAIKSELVESNQKQSVVDPIEIANTGPVRPNANPYFLFFGKFCSQAVQNTVPNSSIKAPKKWTRAAVIRLKRTKPGN